MLSLLSPIENFDFSCFYLILFFSLLICRLYISQYNNSLDHWIELTIILVCDLTLVCETAFRMVFLVLDPGSCVPHDVTRLSSLFSLIVLHPFPVSTLSSFGCFCPCDENPGGTI